jgi:Arc/MetJ-type ribon-helix-helix transcriptional regulator
MEYAHVSAKFPAELNTEIEAFLEETGIYTNKSEFIKEACRTHLRELNSDAAIAALRAQQLLARAEQNPADTAALKSRLEELGEKVDPDDLAEAVEEAREETAESVYGQ